MEETRRREGDDSLKERPRGSRGHSIQTATDNGTVMGGLCLHNDGELVDDGLARHGQWESSIGAIKPKTVSLS
ncbi:hypothetical protein V6N13_028352 [Hibiscus sabdariffa]